MGFLKNSIIVVYIVFNIIHEAPGIPLPRWVINCTNEIYNAFSNETDITSIFKYAFTRYDKSRLDSQAVLKNHIHVIIEADVNYFKYLIRKANTGRMLDANNFCDRHFRAGAGSCLDNLNITYHLKGKNIKDTFKYVIMHWNQGDFPVGSYMRSYIDHMMDTVTLVGVNADEPKSYCAKQYRKIFID